MSTLGVDEIPLAIDLVCPGDKRCPDSGGDGKLYVGAAVRDVTPLVEPFVDVNGNGYYDAGEPFTDLDGDGKFEVREQIGTGHHFGGEYDLRANRILAVARTGRPLTEGAGPRGSSACDSPLRREVTSRRPIQQQQLQTRGDVALH